MPDERLLPERAAIRAALRSCGLSDRQTRALLRAGWGALVGEAKSENEELKERLAEMARRIAT
jgi:hypothetical protein